MSAPTLLNTTSVETVYGYRSLNIWHGDILTSRDDLLIISTHANRNFEFTGQLVREVQSRYGVELDNLQSIVMHDEVFGVYRVNNPGTAPHKAILLLRMPGAYRSRNPLELFKDSIWAVFGSIAALELKNEGFDAISLPFLGGTRGYPLTEAVALILQACGQWLKTSRFTRIINFYLYDEAEAASWSIAMDRVLGRTSITFARDQVASALRDELLAKTSFLADDKHLIKDELKRLDVTLRRSHLTIESLALEGRLLVEAIVSQLCSQHNIMVKDKRLYHRIEAVSKQKIVAPWIISHFHSLRAFGNEGAHDSQDITYLPTCLTEADVIPVLVSTLHVLLLWEALLNQ